MCVVCLNFPLRKSDVRLAWIMFERGKIPCEIETFLFSILIAEESGEFFFVTGKMSMAGFKLVALFKCSFEC